MDQQSVRQNQQPAPERPTEYIKEIGESICDRLVEDENLRFICADNRACLGFACATCSRKARRANQRTRHWRRRRDLHGSTPAWTHARWAVFCEPPTITRSMVA